jgi:hypothetical protein
MALMFGFLTLQASAAPVGVQAMTAAPIAENARIVCEESGYCYRPQGRRPVARWIYGDGAFYGPYTGPGDYGRPGHHYGWSFLGWWW